MTGDDEELAGIISHSVQQSHRALQRHQMPDPEQAGAAGAQMAFQVAVHRLEAAASTDADANAAE